MGAIPGMTPVAQNWMDYTSAEILSGCAILCVMGLLVVFMKIALIEVSLYYKCRRKKVVDLWSPQAETWRHQAPLETSIRSSVKQKSTRDLLSSLDRMHGSLNAAELMV